MTRFLVQPTILLRLEGAALLALCLVLYYKIGGNWLAFALLLLAPDVSMIGYLAGPRMGAAVYNAAHIYPVPAVPAFIGIITGNTVLLSLALIWFAHISMDRMAGYGLKYPTAFTDTHLGSKTSRK